MNNDKYKEMLREQAKEEESMCDTVSAIEQFSTSELKAELRRRKQEVGRKNVSRI